MRSAGNLLVTRILHVTECSSGGVPRAIETMVRNSDGHEHHVLWTAPAGASKFAGFSSISELPHGPISRIRAVRNAIATIEPDVVHAHSSFAGVYTRILPSRVPVIYQPHCYKFDDTSTSPVSRTIYRVAERALARQTDTVVVLSAHEDQLASELRSNTRRHFVPNVATVEQQGDRWISFTRTNDVAMIGRLSSQKDPDYFIRVARDVVARRPETRFTWIGGGDGVDVERMQRAGVRVTGWLGEQALRAELAKPIIYFHSARYEGFPLSVLDAAAYQHPIVVRRIPAFDNANLLQVSTVEEAARTLVEVLDGGPSRALANEGSRSIAETMNPAVQRAALYELYAQYASNT
jgi:glycosyltransferase involved in cell wall biosynthesis